MASTSAANPVFRELAFDLFRILFELDAEADTVCNPGSRTGLHDYAWHTQPDAKKNQTEVEWTRGLRTRLARIGWGARPDEVSYPDKKRDKCDMVIDLSTMDSVWIEAKGAWKEWWFNYGNTRTYESYLFHPLKSGLDASKTHTAATDLQKLSRLDGHATYLGFLLIAFDCRSRPIEPDIHEFRRLAGLDADRWVEFHAQWPDRGRAHCDVKCWFWIRPAERAA